MYCLKCKQKTMDTIDPKEVITKNNRRMMRGNCAKCGCVKCQFIGRVERAHSKSGGKLDIHNIIGKLPRPKAGFTLPNHKYTGPYNPLEKQLDSNDNPIPGQEPYNQVDEIAMYHDICYRDNASDKSNCDKKMLADLEKMEPKNTREKFDKALVSTVIGAKHKLGLGLKRAGDLAKDEKIKIKWHDQLADELHKPVRKNFQKRRVLVSHIDEIWAADLVDMQKLSRDNKGYKYILAVIDIFSKYGWLFPLKSKRGEEVTIAFKNIFAEGRVPEKIWVDKGKEFLNKNLKDLLKKEGVEMYSTENEEKSCMVERWNRTMKSKMYKYFTANLTRTYLDVLPEMTSKYNNTYHRSIKMTPVQASDLKNSEKVYFNLYKNMPEKTEPKFQVGDRVRILKKKNIFDKGFTTNWTKELFIITEVQNTIPPTYKIQDLNGEDIEGTFYEQELQKSKQEIFRIEKIIRSRMKNGKKEILVKWEGYDKSFNSWIPFNAQV